jgi:mono/diheme cytochrome c family protein
VKKYAGQIVFLFAAVITYSQDVKPILDSNCIECHSPGASLDLSQFPFVSSTMPDQTTIVNAMLAKVNANPPQMPPGNRPPLSSDDINTIQQWLNEGLAP